MSEEHEQDEALEREGEQARINEAEWENRANWRLGIFYHSARDTRPFVPKRSMFGRRRFGGTPNFAHRSARAYVMILLGLLVFVLLVVMALERNGIIR